MKDKTKQNNTKEKYKMFEIKKSEIKKAEAAANKFYNRKDCKVVGYYAKPDADDLLKNDFWTVECEIMFWDTDEVAPHKTVIQAVMFDRRRSWASVKNW